MTERDSLLAIDVGTTSTRAIVFSPTGEVLALAQRELALACPQQGWVEQNPREIWEATRHCCRQVLEQCDAMPLCIGITNQRETAILWDRTSGEALYPAISWQDRRTSGLCARLKEEGREDAVAAKTGLLLDPYFSATKLAWMLEHCPGARERAEKGELAFGTPDTWVLWHLTAGKVHATDISNASRTLLFNVVEQRWDEQLLSLFGVPAGILPEVRDNVCAFGTSAADVLGAPLPVGGMAGDQQAALIGQGCLQPGMIKSTYGTGCFALMNIGTQFRRSRHRLLTTVGYRVGGSTSYALEGSIFCAGAAVQWLRDGLKVIASAPESEGLALSVPDSNGVYFVPAFTGLGAPWWRPDLRAMICGIGRESTRAHVVRAALEAQGYQTLDLIQAMQEDGGHAAGVIRADGGLTANAFVCQFLADMVQRAIEVPRVAESTAWGAAMLAGVHAGVFSGLEDAAGHWRLARRYEPGLAPEKRDALYAGWRAAVRMLL